MNIKGFGKTSLEEVLQFCLMLQAREKRSIKRDSTATVDEVPVKDIEQSISELKHTVDCDNDETIKTIINVLSTLLEIPYERRKNNVLAYILAFTAKQEKRNDIFYFYENSVCPLGNINLVNLKKNAKAVGQLLCFLKWCQFDFNDDVNNLYKKLELDKDSRIKKILTLRASGESLGSVGKQLNLSRERVRQLENDCKDIFQRWLARTKFFKKICAENNGDTSIEIDCLKTYFNENAAIIAFLVKTIYTGHYYYDQENDLIVVL